MVSVGRETLCFITVSINPYKLKSDRKDIDAFTFPNGWRDIFVPQDIVHRFRKVSQSVIETPIVFDELPLCFPIIVIAKGIDPASAGTENRETP